MLLHLNLCKSRPCLFLVFKSRFEPTCFPPLPFSTQQLGEHAPETADLYFSYGRALLENAIVQSSVLGKEQREDAIQEDSKGKHFVVFYPFLKLGPLNTIQSSRFPPYSIRVWKWHKCSYSIVFWGC